VIKITSDAVSAGKLDINVFLSIF